MWPNVLTFVDLSRFTAENLLTLLFVNIYFTTLISETQIQDNIIYYQQAVAKLPSE